MRFDSKREIKLQFHYLFTKNKTTNAEGLISTGVDTKLSDLDLEEARLLKSSPACEFVFSDGFNDFIRETASFFNNSQEKIPLTKVEIWVFIWLGRERIEIKLQNRVIDVSNSDKSFEEPLREEGEVRVFKANNEFGGFDWVYESSLINEKNNEKKQEMENFSKELYDDFARTLLSSLTGGDLALTLPKKAIPGVTPVPPNSPENRTVSRAEPTPGEEGGGRSSVLPDSFFYYSYSNPDLFPETPTEVEGRVTFTPGP